MYKVDFLLRFYIEFYAFTNSSWRKQEFTREHGMFLADAMAYSGPAAGSSLGGFFRIKVELN